MLSHNVLHKTLHYTPELITLFGGVVLLNRRLLIESLFYALPVNIVILLLLFVPLFGVVLGAAGRL